jgi:uncharacterized protein DUF6239
MTAAAAAVLLQPGDHGHLLTVGISIGPLILRVVLLAALPMVAGFALLRGFLPEPDRITATMVASVAAGAVSLELMLAGGLDLPAQVVPLILAALAGPLYVIRSRNARFAPAVRLMRLIAPWILGLAGVIAIVEFARAWLGGGSPETVGVLLHTGVILALVALAWFIVCGPRTRLMTGIVRVLAAILATAVIAGGAQAIAPRATDQTAGAGASNMGPAQRYFTRWRTVVTRSMPAEPPSSMPAGYRPPA